MTKETKEVRVIEDPHDLLNWAAEMAINAKPQMPVTRAFIEFFKEHVARVHEHGHLPVPTQQNVFLVETLIQLATPSGDAQAGSRLIGLMMNFLHSQIAERKPTDFYLVMVQLFVAARVPKEIQIGMDEHLLVFRSLPKLTRKHPVNIEVVIPHGWAGQRLTSVNRAYMPSLSAMIFMSVHALSESLLADANVSADREPSALH